MTEQSSTSTTTSTSNPDQNWDLIIFDFDGTLSPMNKAELYPDAAAWLKANRRQRIAIATNQGGVGLRHWMETGGFGNPGGLPTLADFDNRMATIWPDPAKMPITVACFIYQSHKTGEWSPVPRGCELLDCWRQNWRKPAPGMLIRAMQIHNVTPERTLMVGDSDDDRGAAIAANCHFAWAWQFFARPEPVKKGEKVSNG